MATIHSLAGYTNKDWDEPIKVLGNIKVGSTHKMEYNYFSQLSLDPASIVAGCSCTSVSYNATTKKLTVEYQAKEVSKHLKEDLEMDFYHMSQEVLITGKDEKGGLHTYNLIFKATVYENLPVKKDEKEN